MKLAIALAAVCLIAGLLVAWVTGYQDAAYRRSPAGIAMSQSLEQDRQHQIGLQLDLNRLSADRCARPVALLLAKHAAGSIKVGADIPRDIRRDLDLCLDRGIITAFARDELKDAGLLEFIGAR